jgi:hypothetical protein
MGEFAASLLDQGVDIVGSPQHRKSGLCSFPSSTIPSRLRQRFWLPPSFLLCLSFLCETGRGVFLFLYVASEAVSCALPPLRFYCGWRKLGLNPVANL